ncbi:DUF5663 domain-containing protein [Mycolicibacterium vanbaalenii]|uniref:Sensory transduction regulator n=1 Tax=Mycolicibacterium vanbaalenii (strain DSM 7251 / JCM 13017 / BCRC 16820 / KCTC 9966 / NRRL B-24157 / PYR-1) TaxID=350058 RepID=A1THT6_MYCVP|nr:DUF5663 domain-containing protein [Mycolicibacterium vanbaalenii]ABM16736.1 hypothetical protein Mvan_5980 [Mycolicibacterium vanbaalenii PYR-1]MCV7128339.1 YbjN domain-containing protein [Mycolicibacterium vanbaalenii PYR-1]
MPDDNNATTTVDRGIRWDMETQLAASLPGLSDTDLTDLAARVGEELQVRVGTALSSGLTSQQLDEFAQLLDRGDDCQRNDWLETHRPAYRAAVATVRADLVAEVVRTVTAANPAAAHGDRVFARLLPTSIELAEAHFDSHGLKYTRHDAGLRVLFAGGDDDETATVVWVDVAGRPGDTFTLTGAALDVNFAHEDHDRLCAFAADWNKRTWNPKAVVVTDDDGRCKVMGEVALCIGPRVARTQVDVALSRALGSIFALLAEARRTFTGAESDTESTLTDSGGSVVGV